MAIIFYARIDKKLLLVVAMIILDLIDLTVNEKIPNEYLNDKFEILERELGPNKKKKEKRRSIKHIIFLIISKGFQTCYVYFYFILVKNVKYVYNWFLNTNNGIEIILLILTLILF